MPADAGLVLDTPVGRVRLRARAGRLVEVVIGGAGGDGPADPAPDALLTRAAGELAAYFAGTLREFTVPCAPGPLTPFSRTVLEVVRAIPRGTTLTYGEVAARAGSPGAARAVGQVLARNPLPIVIPCHRVLAAGGRPGGYSGGAGLTTKCRLLALEGVCLAGAAKKSDGEPCD